MPKFRFNTRTLALLAVCATLWGCPATVGTGGTPAIDDPDTGGGSFLGQPTPKPNVSPTPRPSPTPTPIPGATPTPTPSPTPTGTPGPTPTPQTRLESLQVLNRISQMWLLEEVPTASPPVSIPSTYSFQAEVVTRVGTQRPSTSSSVVWSSSNPAILSIDATTGYASTSVAQGLYLVTIRAATSNPLAANTISPATVVITVGNSGTLDVTIE